MHSWVLGDQRPDGASRLGTSNKNPCGYSALRLWERAGRLNQPQRRVNAPQSCLVDRRDANVCF